MDKKFLQEHNLMETYKQFMRLCEWQYVPTTLEEDDEEDTMNPQGGDPNAPMDDTNQQGGMNGQMPQGEPIAPMNGGQDMDANMPQDQGMDGSMPQDPNMQDPSMGTEMPPLDDAPIPQENDEVIDVEQLTDAQESMNDKVNLVGRNLGDVDSKITQLLGSLEKMQAMIDNNNQEIANFKQEFEKRNPTQTEKLNLRSLDSYPFNVKPQDYWKEKSEELGSNYSAYADNDKSTTQEYEITNSDVDDFDEREIEHSFDADLDELNQNIAKIFGL